MCEEIKINNKADIDISNKMHMNEITLIQAHRFSLYEFCPSTHPHKHKHFFKFINFLISNQNPR